MHKGKQNLEFLKMNKSIERNNDSIIFYLKPSLSKKEKKIDTLHFEWQKLKLQEQTWIDVHLTNRGWTNFEPRPGPKRKQGEDKKGARRLQQVQIFWKRQSKENMSLTVREELPWRIAGGALLPERTRRVLLEVDGRLGSMMTSSWLESLSNKPGRRLWPTVPSFSDGARLFPGDGLSSWSPSPSSSLMSWVSSSGVF